MALLDLAVGGISTVFVVMAGILALIGWPTLTPLAKLSMYWLVWMSIVGSADLADGSPDWLEPTATAVISWATHDVLR